MVIKKREGKKKSSRKTKQPVRKHTRKAHVHRKKPTRRENEGSRTGKRGKKTTDINR